MAHARVAGYALVVRSLSSQRLAMIRTILVDDSPTFQSALTTVLHRTSDFRLVATAQNGLDGLRLVRQLRPDLVLMDVMMPGMNGFETTAHIMSETPCAVVIMSTLVEKQSQRLVFEAMRAGAVEVLGKPRDLLEPSTCERLLGTLRAMAQVRVVRHRRPGGLSPAGSAVQLVALGASTGGPPALREILSHLPLDFPAPILVAQHLAAGFAHGLRNWLAEALSIDVLLVEQATEPRPGCVYLAPDNRDIELSGPLLVPIPCPTSHRSTPSVDRLFSSVAASARGAVGILLTGMGDDGARGLKQMRNAGQHTIAQDEATCLVYGMPQVALELEAAREQLPLPFIGPRLVQLAKERQLPT